MTLPDELISVIGPIVESVGADYGRRYRQFGADQQDMAQSGWLWAFDHPRKVIQWFDPEQTEPRAGERLLAQALRNECHDYGETLKAQHLGYSRDDLMYYSRAMVEGLLPSVLDPEAWLHPEQSDGERRGRGAPAEGGNWIATLADISRAFEGLDSEDRDLLKMFHEAPVWRNVDAAKYFGVSEQTMSYRHSMAIKRLVKALGGPKPKPQHDEECDHGWIGRHSMSNAAARSVQQSYYEEG